MPKSASPSLIDFLASLGPTVNPYVAELYTFTLVGGLVLRYTTADVDVAYGGNTWSSGTVRFQDPNNRALGHWKIGLDVDSWQVLAIPRRIDPHSGTLWPDMVGDQPFLAALYGGAFDAADVEVDYAFFSAPPSPGATTWTPIGTVQWFRGRVAECDVGQSAAVITINDYRELLTLQMPRHVFGASCRFNLYGPGCGLNPASFAVSGTVGAGSSDAAIVSSIGAPGGSGTYALGYLTMTSGANDGFSRMVRAWSGGVLSLANPFYWPLNVGDTFTAYPGCDLTMAGCTAFANLTNFGGQPFIPAPETAS